jgi:hypothetical protein
MASFKVGDKVIMIREPSEDEWADIGEVSIPKVLYQRSHQIKDINSTSNGIRIDSDEDDAWYPSCCFKLLPTSPSMADRLIAEARKRYPKGTYFFSAESGNSVRAYECYEYDESHDRLTDDGWAVYFQGKWAAVDGHANKQLFQVGDLVLAHRGNGYSYTTDGWEGIVVETSSDPDTEKDIKVQGINGHKECSTTEGEGWWVSSDKFDLISKGSHILSQTKTSENGKAKHDDSERVIKVSHNDFEVSRGNQIRGSRINGTASEVTIGNRHRHDEARPIRF